MVFVHSSVVGNIKIGIAYYIFKNFFNLMFVLIAQTFRNILICNTVCGRVFQLVEKVADILVIMRNVNIWVEIFRTEVHNTCFRKYLRCVYIFKCITIDNGVIIRVNKFVTFKHLVCYITFFSVWTERKYTRLTKRYLIVINV